jgi:hypothetical protein
VPTIAATISTPASPATKPASTLPERGKALKMKNMQIVSGVNYELIGVHDGALGLFISCGEMPRAFRERRTRREAGFVWGAERRSSRRAHGGARHLRRTRLLLGQGVHTGQRHHRHEGGEAERNGALEKGAGVHGVVLCGGWCGVDG